MRPVGFIILAHDRLDRAAWLADQLSPWGPVVVHVDTAVAVPDGVFGPEIAVISTRRTAWGQFGLVEAVMDAARTILANGPLGHVCLLSGACLPLQPLSDLVAHLQAHSGTEFIESVPAEKGAWVKGGLSTERFRLYFLFNWRRQRWLFDRFVEIQRRLGIRRRVPTGLVPHLGLQWWALTGATLSAILDHSELPRWRRYFRLCWIPDECFFQTLVRHVGTENVAGKGLTLQHFDADGVPMVFHDDHAKVLSGSSSYFARKIDPDATELYTLFPAAGRAPAPEPRTMLDTEARPASEPCGCATPGRVVTGTRSSWAETARPYLAVLSFDTERLAAARAALASTGLRTYGRLFDLAHFAPVADAGQDPLAEEGPGNLPTSMLLREYRPSQYLSRLVWANRDGRMALLFHPGDHKYVRACLVQDANARLLLLDEPNEIMSAMTAPLADDRRPHRRRRFRTAAPTALTLRSQYIEVTGDNVMQRLRTIALSDWDTPDGWQRLKGPQTTPPTGVPA
ncbi:MAG: beta-1,6-N-acetylglucosaminyltransferase [Pseudomonadota bacterium]